MKKHLGLAILLGLAAAPDGLSAQAGESDLERARRSGSGIVVGGRPNSTLVPDVYTVRRGDTLWDISGRFFGNPWEWPRVWSYNPEITNPHWIYPLDRLCLRAEGEAQPLPETSVRAPERAEVGTVWLRDQGYLDQEALEESGVIVGSPEEQMLLSTYDDIYVRFDDEAPVQPGREYTVFRVIGEDERNPDESGQLVRIYGTVRLRSYDRDRGVGRATITEALDPIERGYRIAPVPRRFEVVPPRENAQDVQAEVVATLRPRSLSADYQIVFLDAGREQGVQLGNRFFVVRAGDEWRESLSQRPTNYGTLEQDVPDPDEEDLPPEVIAEGRVVDVRDNTSTLIIMRSVHELAVGDRAEMRQGF